MDVEGRIPRALESLGPITGRATAVLDLPGTPWVERLRAIGPDSLLVVPPDAGGRLVIPAPDATLDAVVTLWTGFRGVDPADLAEVERALRPGGRLLVVHDYGRDDASALRDPDAPEYRSWSRRDGPFLRLGGFKIRVIHCFLAFADIDAAREALAGFGERGEALAARVKRPRISWNVAVYHRGRLDLPADGASDGESVPGSGNE
jgi:SAM-dependent methyltransferase